MSATAVSPRLIATDLYGTLLRGDGTISPRTRAALARVRRAGIEVVLATGRPARHVRALADAGVPVICLNGALVYDVERHAIIDETRLTAAVACDLVERLRARLPGTCFAVEVGLEFGWEPSYGRHRAKLEPALLPLADARALCARGVNKLIGFHPELAPDAFVSRSSDVVGEHAFVAYSGAPFLEISARGVSKAAALADYCAARGIAAREVIAFGDMPNDLPMLAWAGRGIAMSNAHASVLAAVAESTLSNDDDGVAQVLEQLVPHH